MLIKLALKNICSRKSSLVIILFISFAITLLSVSNALFDTSEKGVQETFKKSFTGDFIIRPLTDVPLSLFGDETPFTGELTKIKTIVPFEKTVEYLSDNNEIEDIVFQVSGTAAAENSEVRIPAFLFGVMGKDYCNLMKGINILEGVPFENDQRGAMISSQKAHELGLKPGQIIQFSVADGINFRIRAVPVTAIYDYNVYNNLLDKIVLVDPFTVRSLMDISSTVSSKDIVLSDYEDTLINSDINDELFNFDDTDAVLTDFDVNSSAIEKVDSVQPEEKTDSTSWNFIIVKAGDGTNSANLIKHLNKDFKKFGWQIEAVNWRHAAGKTALYLYWMRLIFNIGIIIVLIVGFIVINNTLVINILDRSREIGTMKAIGASSLFISLECMCETFLLTFTAEIFSILFTILFIQLINMSNIVFTNSYLIQLFGNSTLAISYSGKTLLDSLYIALALGIIAWLYPVKIALKMNPVQAMQGGK